MALELRGEATRSIGTAAEGATFQVEAPATAPEKGDTVLVFVVLSGSETLHTLTPLAVEEANGTLAITTVGKGEVVKAGEKKSAYVLTGTVKSVIHLLPSAGELKVAGAGSVTWEAVVVVIKGAATINVESAAWNVGVSGTTTPTITSVSPSVVNTLAFAFIATTVSTTSTWASTGWSESHASGGTNMTNGMLATKSFAASGAIGTITYKKASAKETAGMVLLISEGSGGAVTLGLTTAAASGSAALAIAALRELSPNTAAASTSVSLSAAATVLATLSAASAVTAATLNIAATTSLPLTSATSASATSLSLAATVTLSLGTASSSSATSLAFASSGQLALGPATSESSSTLTIAGARLLPLGAATSESSSTLSFSATTPIPFAGASSTSAANLAFAAAAPLALNPAQSSSSATLGLFGATTIPLNTAPSISAASLSLKAPVTLSMAAQSASSAGLTLTAAVVVALQVARSTTSTSLGIATHTVSLEAVIAISSRKQTVITPTSRRQVDITISSRRQVDIQIGEVR